MDDNWLSKIILISAIALYKTYRRRDENGLSYLWNADCRCSNCYNRVAFRVCILRRSIIMMANVVLFLLGFTSVTTVYEIVKTGKRTKSDKVSHAVDTWKKTK